jgi:hypothetical protein
MGLEPGIATENVLLSVPILIIMRKAMADKGIILKIFMFSLLLPLFPGFFMACADLGIPLCLAEDITIGAVEDVILLPWGVKMPARIDTGAATSSLDTRELKIKDGFAEFNLPEPYGGQTIRLPVKKMRSLRSSSGREKRPIVDLTICVGRQTMHIEANLANRSGLEFPLLLGRNVIGKGFIVDVRQAKKLQPDCPHRPTP